MVHWPARQWNSRKLIFSRDILNQVAFNEPPDAAKNVDFWDSSFAGKCDQPRAPPLWATA